MQYNPNQSYDFGLKIQLSQKKNSELFGFQDFYGFQQLKAMKQQQNKYHDSKSKTHLSEPIHKIQELPNIDQTTNFQKTDSQAQFKKQITPTFCQPPIQSKFAFTFKKKQDSRKDSQSQKSRVIQNEVEDNIQSLKGELIFYTKSSQKFEYECNKIRQKQCEIIQLDQILSSKVQKLKQDLSEVNKELSEIINYNESLKINIQAIQGEKSTLIRQIKQQLVYQIPENITLEQKFILQKLSQIQKQIFQIQSNQKMYLNSQLNQKQLSIQQNKTDLIEKVYELTLKSKDPNLLYNIKLACLRQRWILLENQHIQIGVVYQKQQNQIYIEMHIGNKSRKQLIGFSLVQKEKNGQQKKVYNNQILGAQNYLKAQKVVKDFIGGHLYEYYIQYQIINKIQLSCMIPVTFLNFGDFQIISMNNYLKKWRQSKFKYKSEDCAFDNEIVSNVLQIKKYIHNLVDILSKKHQRYVGGLFRFNNKQMYKEQILIKFKQKSCMLKFVICSSVKQIKKDRIKIIMNHLKFIFSI